MVAKVNSNIFNKAYQPFFASTHKHQHLMGGGGSAKSYTAAQKIVFIYLLPYTSVSQWESAMAELYGHREAKMLIASGRIKPKNIRPWKEKILLIRSQQAQVRKSQFEDIKNVLANYGLSEYVKINDNSMTMEAHNGNKILCAGLRGNGAENLKSIPNITRFWIEEATDSGVNFNDISTLELRLGRLAACKDPCIIMTYNPIHENHWINRYYWLNRDIKSDLPLHAKEIERNNRIVFKLKTTYKDNRFLGKAFIEDLEAKKYSNPNAYRIYGLGDWGGTPEGCVYTNWEKTGAFPDAIDKIVYGIDKGFNHPYAIVRVGYLPIDIYTNELVDGVIEPVLQAGAGLYVQEVAYDRGLTTTEMIAKYGDILPKDAQYYIDPSAAADKKEWRLAGFTVSDAQNSVDAGITFLKNMRIYVVSNQKTESKPLNNLSMNVLSEFMAYKYQFNKTLGSYSDTPDKINDDAMDAMRYAGYSGFRSIKNQVRSMII